MSERRSEAAFEAVIEAHLLANGYVTVNRDSFDREWVIFSATALIAAAVTGRISIRESTEDTLLGKCAGKMRC
jgi:hypothetical protein